MIAIMEKIILKDGTEYEILTGATNYTFAIMVKNMIEVSRIVEKLTTENLSSFTLQLDYTTLIVTHKALNTVSASPDEIEDFPAHFELRDVSTTEIEIRELKEQIVSLQEQINTDSALYDSTVMVARFSLATLSDEQALQVVNLFLVWSADGKYKKGEKYTYNGILYRCLQDHDGQATWTPEDAPSLWTKVLIPDPEVIPEWEQPESTNGYKIGDKVAHNGKTWESLVDNNVWEPGVVGTEGQWKEVTDQAENSEQ